jgi:uncharacterized Ntn-hydrolase superfamily protein
VQSKFLAVGSLVAWGEANVGAVATQAWMNPAYGPDGLALLREGRGAQEVVDRLTTADDGRAQRQLGVVDAGGDAAAYTGAACLGWAGSRTGDGYAAQGNILVSGATVDAMADTFEASAGARLATRLLAALAAAQAAGGDRRGQQAAAVLVVEKGGGYGGCDVAVDLRVDDHEQPVAELRRLLDLHELYFGETPASEWVPVVGALADELPRLLARVGYESGHLGADLDAWAGYVNLEERVRGTDVIDPVVLEQLRKEAAR